MKAAHGNSGLVHSFVQHSDGSHQSIDSDEDVNRLIKDINEMQQDGNANYLDDFLDDKGQQIMVRPAKDAIKNVIKTPYDKNPDKGADYENKNIGDKEYNTKHINETSDEYKIKSLKDKLTKLYQLLGLAKTEEEKDKLNDEIAKLEKALHSESGKLDEASLVKINESPIIKNPTHKKLLAAGWKATHYPHWVEDRGGPESGPMIHYTPAYKIYTKKGENHDHIIDAEGNHV